MTKHEQIEILKKGVNNWNTWRGTDIFFKPDLSGADLGGIDLSGVNFNEVNLSDTKLQGVNLSNAELRRADLSRSNLSKAVLKDAYLYKAILNDTNLQESDIEGAVLAKAHGHKADFNKANLSVTNFNAADFQEAIFSGSKLTSASFVNTNLSKADLTGCFVFGVSAWGVKLDDAKQANLVITQAGEPKITVDNLEVAQFIYLIINNKKIQKVIDTITSKIVLILGNFSPERKQILYTLKDELRNHDYTPILFDFDRPLSRDLIETVILLAHLSRFIIADITSVRSVPNELQAIIPNLAVPILPLLQNNETEYGMFTDQYKYDWVLDVQTYQDKNDLLSSISSTLLPIVEKKFDELSLKRIKRFQEKSTN